MDKGSLIKLKEQLDAAIGTDTPQARAALARGLADTLKEALSDEAAAALDIIEDVWLRGLPPPSPLPVGPESQARLARLLSDMRSIQDFALAVAKGDLSPALKAGGMMAGSFKALQGSLRHLTWQTGMIARGDFSQRVDFMGEFSESFNSMVQSLSEANDRIKRYTEQLERVNADLTAEIEERKQAEEALRVSRKWLRVTLNSIGDAVLTTDTQGRITFLNPVAEALTGWETTEASGLPSSKVFNIINEKTGEAAEDIIGRVLREGRIALLANNTALICRDGRRVPIEDSAAPIKNSEGELLGVVLIFRDVAEKRLAREELKRARDELEIRVQERTAELEKVNRDLSDFNHIATHDLQEPLRQLITFGDRLVSKCGADLSSKDRYYIDRIQVLARRASSLTNDILKYSLMSSRSRFFSATDLNRLIDEVALDFKDEMELKEAALEVERLRPLEVDRAQMGDVFRNLLSNALKFTREEKPKIKIYGESTDNGLYRIFVEDNGMGFDEAFLEKIFIPFQRLHARSKYEGSGIGLAICRKILELHGGAITAKSQLNSGSTFILSLPLDRKK